MLNLRRGWFYAVCALLVAGLLLQLGLIGYIAATVTALAAGPTAAPPSVVPVPEPDLTATTAAEQTATAEAEQIATAEAELTATAEAELTATAEALAAEAQRFQQLSAGINLTCGLTVAGWARCWGELPDGWSDPPRERRYTQVVAGERFACGIRESDSIAECWGAEPLSLPETPVRQITMVNEASFCWILRNPLETESKTGCASNTGPAPVVPNTEDSPVLEIASNVTGTLLCTRSKQTLCNNSRPGLIDNPFISDGPIAKLSVGSSFPCALFENSRIMCNEFFANDIQGRYSDVSAGAGFACGIGSESQEVACWGNAPQGTPQGPFVRLSTASNHICAIRVDETATCWGPGASDPPPWTPSS